MITTYVRKGEALAAAPSAPESRFRTTSFGSTCTIPATADEKLVEAALRLDVPTREEMKEIEVSSRLYAENGALFMTASLATGADTDDPTIEPITFILTGHRLVTVRYADPTPFRTFAGDGACVPAPAFASGEAILSGLLDAAVDRLADLLERVQADIHQLSHTILAKGKTRLRRGAPQDRPDPGAHVADTRKPGQRGTPADVPEPAGRQRAGQSLWRAHSRRCSMT